MKNLAPHIFRQRLLIEGHYQIAVDEPQIREFFTRVTAALQLRTYAEPIVFSPEALGSEGNQGYDAFVPLVDSGIALYVWTSARFLSLVFYTCKGFDEASAIEITRTFFAMSDVAHCTF